MPSEGFEPPTSASKAGVISISLRGQISNNYDSVGTGRLARASHRAVARFGLGTASPFRLLAQYGSGVRFSHASKAVCWLVWARGDSNSQGLLHTLLRRTRIPDSATCPIDAYIIRLCKKYHEDIVFHNNLSYNIQQSFIKKRVWLSGRIRPCQG